MATEEQIRAIPKTDLHVHLDGSLRPSTLLELAEEAEVDLPAANEEEVRKLTQMGDGERSLPRYLSAFAFTLPSLQTESALERAAYELAIDAAAENVWWLEVRYSPLLHKEKGLQFRSIIDAVARGLERAEEEVGIQSGQILCGIRHMTPEKSMELAKATLLYQDKGVVAFDLAGAERDYPAKKHREAFYFVLNHNLNSTLHAGEAFGPESIAQALHYCGAHRIGHGVQLWEDPALLNYVNDHRIPLEMCLSSNLHTGAVEELHDHPFHKYLAMGLRVTLNTDNRLMSNTTVTRELQRAADTFDLSTAQIREVVLNGFKSSFRPQNKKRKMVQSVLAEFERIGIAAEKGEYI